MKTKESKEGVALKALKFIAVIAIITSATYGALEYTPLRSIAAAYTAYASQFFLLTLGEDADLVWLENPHLLTDRFDAELIPLCWGTLEIALWAGVVFATTDRSLQRRAHGFLAGMAAFLLFNPGRIAVTLKLFDASRPFASEIVHDLLFRASLFALFVAAYAIWYAWPEKALSHKKRDRKV